MKDVGFFLSSLLAVSERHDCYNSSVYVCAWVCVCVHPSKFVWTITSTIVNWYQNDLTQLFSIMCGCAIWNICSGWPKVKVTLEGEMFVRTIIPIILDGFQYKFAQWFSIMSRCAIWRFYSGSSKVKVMRARRIVSGQPCSFTLQLTFFIAFWQDEIIKWSIFSFCNSIFTLTHVLSIMMTCDAPKKKPFNNIVGKGENARNKNFLLIQQCFLPNERQI